MGTRRKYKQLLLTIALLLLALPCYLGSDTDSNNELSSDAEEVDSRSAIPDDLVLVADQKSWAKAVTNHPLMIVYFSARWCDYCKQLTPEYFKAAAQLYKDRIDAVKFVIIGATDANRALLDKYKVTRYPTVMILDKGVPSTIYRGEYEFRKISQFAKSSTVAPVAHLTSMDDLEKFLKAVRENSDYAVDAKCVVGIERTGAERSENIPLSTFLAAARARAPGDGYGPFALIRGQVEVFNELMSRHIDNNPEANENGFYILVFSASDARPMAIEGLYDDSTSDDLLRYIDSFHLPVILEYHESNLKRIQWFANGVQVLIFSPSSSDANVYSQRWPEWLQTHHAGETESGVSPWDKAGDLFLGVVSQVADMYRGRVLFIHVPESEYHIYQIFHVDRKEGFNPEVMIVDLRNAGQMTRYQFSSYSKYMSLVDEAMLEISEDLLSDSVDMESALSVDTKHTRVDNFRAGLQSFLSKFSNGKLTPTMVSEPLDSVPEYVEGSVQKLVSENFVSTVTDENIDVYIVAFMAPWCGHCKALEPILDTLARYFITSDDEDTPIIRVGKIDATQNEISYPGVRVYGYPTLFIFHREYEAIGVCLEGDNDANSEQCGQSVSTVGGVKVVEYDGPRTVRDIKKAVRSLTSSS